MTIDFRIRGRRCGARLSHRAQSFDTRPPLSLAPRDLSSSSASAASASMRRCCARRWRAPLAPPTPMAAGIGRPAYDACEAATVLFLRKFGPAMRGVPICPPRCCRCWPRSPAFFPPTPAVPKRARRFSSSSTPIALGFAACVTAAAITPADRRAGAFGWHRLACCPG